MNFTFADPAEWWLEILSSTQSIAWQQSQVHSTPSSCWNAYINQICLETVLAWFKTDYTSEATAWLSPHIRPTVWEVVTGSAITLAGKRFVLIPTEAIDDSELEIPQEWIDIPSWAGDYYLTAQVMPEDNQVRVWCYTTHRNIKSNASYDSTSRTYCLDAKALTQDMSKLSIAMQFCPNEQTRSTIAPLTEVSSAQVKNLIQQLSHPSITFTRLALPFQQWAALIERDEWRQELYQQRVAEGQPADRPVAVRLSAWLQNQFETTWQEVEAILSSQPVEAWRIRKPTRISRVKVLDFGTELAPKQIALLVGVTPGSTPETNIELQISPIGNLTHLPNETQIRLLTETGTEIGQARATITKQIQLQLSGRQGERFSVEVTCRDKTITELFEI
jgi:hypothetical protein